jgi:hypothetical protein
MKSTPWLDFRSLSLGKHPLLEPLRAPLDRRRRLRDSVAGEIFIGRRDVINTLEVAKRPNRARRPASH